MAYARAQCAQHHADRHSSPMVIILYIWITQAMQCTNIVIIIPIKNPILKNIGGQIPPHQKILHEILVHLSFRQL